MKNKPHVNKNAIYLHIALVMLVSLACLAPAVASDVYKRTSPPPQMSTDVKLEMVVTADTLNIRYGAGENYPAVGILSRGDTVTCTEFAVAKDGGQWCKHERGWSNARWLEAK